MHRLAIISTHPIQYNAPLFRELASEDWIEIKVFYTWSQRESHFLDTKFGKEIQWDIPLLEGYDFSFVVNQSPDPGNHHFKGIDCPALREEIQLFRASAILVYGWNFKAHLQILRRFSGRIPILFRGDSTLLDESPGVKLFLRRVILSWIYRKTDYALYVGEANRLYYRAHGIKEKQLFYAPHAIDNQRFTQDEQKHSTRALELRREMGIGDNEQLILFAGKFEKKKRPDLLVEAKIAAHKHPESNLAQSRLLFVGNGILENDLKEKAAGFEDILFMDFRNQSMMPAVYRMADVLCLPSSGPGETWGLVVNEAMACGIKCVISDKCGSAMNLGNFAGNQVFKNGSVQDLSEKLKISLGESKPNNEPFLAEYNYTKVIDAIRQVLS